MEKESGRLRDRILTFWSHPVVLLSCWEERNLSVLLQQFYDVTWAAVWPDAAPSHVSEETLLSSSSIFGVWNAAGENEKKCGVKVYDYTGNKLSTRANNKATGDRSFSTYVSDLEPLFHKHASFTILHKLKFDTGKKWQLQMIGLNDSSDQWLSWCFFSSSLTSLVPTCKLITSWWFHLLPSCTASHEMCSEMWARIIKLGRVRQRSLLPLVNVPSECSYMLEKYFTFDRTLWNLSGVKAKGKTSYT